MTKGDNLKVYLKEIIITFKENTNPENIQPMKEYMKNKFDFLGIKTPQRRKLSRKFLKKANRPEYDKIGIVIKELWELPEREYQYYAIELLEKYTKNFSVEIIELFDFMITNINNNNPVHYKTNLRK